MKNHFFTAVLFLIVLTFFTACSASPSSSSEPSVSPSSEETSADASSEATLSGPSDAKKVLAADEFSLFKDGKAKISLKTDSQTMNILYMQQQNQTDNTTYETKRGLKLGDGSSQIVQRSPDVTFTYSIGQYDTSVSENNAETAEQALNKYKTLGDFLKNESGMGLSDNEYIMISYTQYVGTGGDTYTQKQLQDKLNYKPNMTEKEYKEFGTQLKKYDAYSLNFAVKDGKISNIAMIFSPRTVDDSN